MPDHLSPSGCMGCQKAEHCLVRGLEHDDAVLIEDLTQRKIRVHQSETLFRAGDVLNDIFAVKSGALKVMVGSEDGRESIVALYLSGDVFGTDGLESATRTSTAVALEDTEVCVVPWAPLATLAQQSPAIQQVVMRIFSARIHRKHKLMLALGTMRAEERMAAFLLDLSRRFGKRGLSSQHLVLPVSRKEIANHLAIELETVSRILSNLVRDGILNAKQRNIEIRDFTGLVHVAGCQRRAQEHPPEQGNRSL